MSTTSDDIKKATQAVAKLERQLALQKVKARKADTRRKIEFGGLVIKAELNQYSKAVILGALLSIMADLGREPELEALFKLKGEAAFMDHLS